MISVDLLNFTQSYIILHIVRSQGYVFFTVWHKVSNLLYMHEHDIISKKLKTVQISEKVNETVAYLQYVQTS